MRKFGMFLALAAMLLMSVGWSHGQQGQRKGGGFGGGMIGGQRQNPLNLLNNPQIKKELDVTDEQIEKLPAEVMNAIAKVLNEKQLKRFKQIELQQRGNNAFKDESIQKSLTLSDDQKKTLTGIVDESNKDLTELFKGVIGARGDFKGIQEKQDTIRKEAKEKIYGVLTKDQRKAWRDMIGEDFKLETPTFGGGGGFGGFGKKGTTDPKKDDK